MLDGSVFDARWLQSHGELQRQPAQAAAVRAALAWGHEFLTTTRPTWNGHNSSTWREEVLAVNGFDERLGYGGLDREFGERLERCGMQGIQARYSLICLHLDHPRPYRAREIMAANMRIRRDNAALNVRRTRHGLSPHMFPQMIVEQRASTGA